MQPDATFQHCPLCALRRGWARLAIRRDLAWLRLVRWRNRVLGDGMLGLVIVGMDWSGFIFRVAIVVAAVIAVGREIAAAI